MQHYVPVLDSISVGGTAGLFVVELVEKSDFLHNITRDVANELQFIKRSKCRLCCEIERSMTVRIKTLSLCTRMEEKHSKT